MNIAKHCLWKKKNSLFKIQKKTHSKFQKKDSNTQRLKEEQKPRMNINKIFMRKFFLSLFYNPKKEGGETSYVQN